MFDELDKYKSNGHFFYTPNVDLKKVCNAPKDGIGVFYILKLAKGKIEIAYIGSEGEVEKNGEIYSAGLYHQIVKGKQFGAPRFSSWKEKLESEGIDGLDIYWFETFDKKNQDSPTYVKALIMQSFLSLYGRLPEWNEKF